MKYECLLKCTAIKIPEDRASQEYEDFCDKHGITSFKGQEREGWMYSIGMYVSGAKYLIYLDGEAITFGYDEDLYIGNEED